jgi:ABC-type branched-subunit amino acid transport system substrate-binding protein
MRRTNRAALAVACAASLALSACGDDGGSDGGGGGESAAGGTIKLGYLTSLSGAASAGFTGLEGGANARLEAYKAAGGECADNDFEIVMGDDTSNPQGALTATQNLIQQEEVYAVLPSSSFFYGAGQYAGTQASGTPFIGASFDGGEQWQNEEYRNLFTAIGSVDYNKVAGTYGDYWSELGGTKAAAVAFDTPSSSGAALAAVQGAEDAGLDRGYVNVNVPFGTTDVGAIVLGIQESGADVLYLPLTPDTAFAIVGGLKQAGVDIKSVLLATGYGADLLKSEPAVQAAQGVGFVTTYAPTELETEATQAQSEALTEYAGSESGIPSFSEAMGWLTTDLFLHGLELAGCDASQEEYIDSLRDDASWDAGGLLGEKNDFSQYGNIAGGTGPGNCFYVSILQERTFVPDENAKPICGELLDETVQR